MAPVFLRPRPATSNYDSPVTFAVCYPTLHVCVLGSRNFFFRWRPLAHVSCCPIENFTCRSAVCCPKACVCFCLLIFFFVEPLVTDLVSYSNIYIGRSVCGLLPENMRRGKNRPSENIFFSTTTEDEQNLAHDKTRQNLT